MAMEGCPPHPQFFKVLLPGFLKKLPLPPAFTKQINIDSDRETTIMSPLGKSWQVRIHGEGKHMYFGEGWKGLARAHDLRVGYLLLFSYLEGMLFTFKVFDLSACEKKYRPVYTKIVKPEVIDLEDDQNTGKASKAGRRHSSEEMTVGEVRAKESFCGKKPNRFEVIIRRSYLSARHLKIPMAFKATSGFSENVDMTFIDPKGRSWPVSLRLYREKGIANHRPILGRGWHKFAVENNLAVGDKCTFELVSKQKRVVHVQILKR